ncbi:hypothetical protein [Streptomyces sp. JW3]|uniref:hypothetical protein n=1 Tax=Streptomyces sp. JW3 TaxID=3456955 RepID=UPI003FA41A0D
MLLLGGFVLRQATSARPLLPLRMFRSRSLAVANVVQFLMIALGYGSLAAGLSFVPVAVVIAVVSVGCSARFITRFGQRPLLFGGLGLIAAAFVLLSFARVDGTYLVDFLPASLVMGLGFGLAAPAVMGLGMAAVVPAESGVASGLSRRAGRARWRPWRAVTAWRSSPPRGSCWWRWSSGAPCWACGGGGCWCGTDDTLGGSVIRFWG